MESSKNVADVAAPTEQPTVSTIAKLCQKLACGKTRKVPAATSEVSPGKKAKGSGIFATLAARGPKGRDLQSLQSQLTESQEAAAVLQGLLQATREELEDLEHKLNIMNQSETAELAGLWRALRLNKKAGKDLVAQLQTMTSRRERLEIIVRNLTTLHEKKLQAYEKKHADKLAEQRRVMDEKGELRQAMLNHTKAVQNLGDLEAQRLAALRDLEKANEKAEGKDMQIERLETRIAVLHQQVWDGNMAANEHRKELEAQTLKVKGVERRLQKRGEDIDRLRDEKDQLEVELAKLRSVGSETPTDKETEALREEVANLRKFFLRVTSEPDPATEDEVREREAATLAAQTAAREALGVARELAQQVQDLTAQVSRLTEKAREDEEVNRTVDELVKDLEDKEKELQTSRSTVESLERDLEAQGSEAMVNLRKELTQELDVQREYLAQACAAADKAEDEVKELQEQLTTAQEGKTGAETAACARAQELERVKEIAQQACAAADKAVEEAAEERRQKATAQQEAITAHARATELEQELEVEKEGRAVADTAVIEHKEKSKKALAVAAGIIDAAENFRNKLKEEQQLKQIAQQVADEAQAKNAALEQQLKQEQEARATAEAQNAELLLQLQSKEEESRLQAAHMAELEAKMLALEAAAKVPVPLEPFCDSPVPSPLPADVPSSPFEHQQEVSEPEPVEAIKAELEECDNNRARTQERVQNDAPIEDIKQTAPVCLNPTARSSEAPRSRTRRRRGHSTGPGQRETMPVATGLTEQSSASLLPPRAPGKSNLTAAVSEFVPASTTTTTAVTQLKPEARSFQPGPPRQSTAPMGHANNAVPQHARAVRPNAVPFVPQGDRFQGHQR